MFTKNIFQSIFAKWGFRPVEKRVHARVKQIGAGYEYGCETMLEIMRLQ